MKRLRSYVQDRWQEASGGFAPLHDPCTEEVIAEASSEGLDFAAALAHARDRGGPTLRAMTFAERGELLLALSKAIHAGRDELIELSLRSTGTTRKDAKFDLDGATGTLSFYGYLGKELGDRRFLLDGEGVALGRSARFYGQHVLLPLTGVAVHVNAFNFPAWGFAEKAACSLLAGVPAIEKPATSTAFVTARCFELMVEAGALPPGVLSLVVGSTGPLLSLLGPQDAFGFTGSATTALALRGQPNLLAASVRVNIEADSLNASVLGPDVEEGSETWNLFLRELEREVTQKSGQKCTAVRRVFAPSSRVDILLDALRDRLSRVVTGNPADPTVTMGPLTSAKQLSDAISGVARLRENAALVLGSGERIDGVGSPAGKGYYFGPALLRANEAASASVVHSHEVFGPVATVLPYDGSADQAAALVSLGGGSLVTSLYSDDDAWTSRFVLEGGPWAGRVYLGSEKMAEQAPGSGLALPQSLHGGPGRAGGGEELGGVRGLSLYLRRVALQGSRSMVGRIAGERGD